LIILSLDLETTGLDTAVEQPIEVGAVLYSTGQYRILESASYLVKTTRPITSEITGITGLVPQAVAKFGFESKDGLENLLGMFDYADAIIGQNVIRYDKKILESWSGRDGINSPEKLYIDTRTDLPGVQSKHLGYMLADIGKINPFPHSALTDALSVIILVEHYSKHATLNGYASPDAYVKDMVKLAESPNVVLVGKQDRADNSLVKKEKFAWNPDLKIWWKIVKECQLEAYIAKLPFNVAKAGPEISIEKLWYST
jgi:DNA polymerase-3 subunit epsilon